MNNLEELYDLQKKLIKQLSAEEIELTDEENAALNRVADRLHQEIGYADKSELEQLFDRVNRAIETSEKAENERLRIESEKDKAKKQLIASIASSVLGLAGQGLHSATSMINVGRILHAETNDILCRSQAMKFVPNR